MGQAVRLCGVRAVHRHDRGTARYLDQLLLGRSIGGAINVYSITVCVATGIAALVTKETCGLYPHKLYLHEVKTQ